MVHISAPTGTCGIVPVGHHRRIDEELDCTLLIVVGKYIGDNETFVLKGRRYFILLNSCSAENLAALSTVLVNGCYGIFLTTLHLVGQFLGIAKKGSVAIDIVGSHLVAVLLWFVPSEHSICQRKVCNRLISCAIYNSRYHQALALLCYFEFLSTQIERTLNTLKVVLEVDDACGMHLTCTYVLVLLSGNHEEVLHGLVCIKCRAEVGQVVHKLHGRMVQLTVPVTQHGDCRSRICIAVVTITAITEVVHVGDVIGFCGIQIGAYTYLQKQFATVGIVHLQLDGTQGTEVLAGMIELAAPVAGCHLTCSLIAYRTGKLIGTIDEALVLPVAPTVDDNPCTLLVLIYLTGNTVVVKVELDAVVPTNHGHGMVHLCTPAVNIVHACHTGSIICGSLWNIPPLTT